MILKYAIVIWLCSLTVEIFDVHLTGEVLWACRQKKTWKLFDLFLDASSRKNSLM